MNKARLLSKVRDVLAERMFTETQIEKIVPRLQSDYIHQPDHLANIIDTWNIIMRNAGTIDPDLIARDQSQVTGPTRPPPKSLLLKDFDIDMTTILADIEPDLLMLDPEKLRIRHNRLLKLSLSKNLSEQWLLLYYAPRGFYLQDWRDLSKKLYYIEHNIFDLLYDKKDLKLLEVNPIVKNAAVVGCEFDHIRARYLFALRSGYKSLSHLYPVQMALERATLKDLILSDNKTYLSKFSPFCSEQEYNSFTDLIKNHDFDEDDAEVFEKLAELESLT